VERVGGEGVKHNLMQVLLSQAIQCIPSPSRAADYVTPSGCTELWFMLAMIPNWCRTAVSTCDASDYREWEDTRSILVSFPCSILWLWNGNECAVGASMHIMSVWIFLQEEQSSNAPGLTG